MKFKFKFLIGSVCGPWPHTGNNWMLDTKMFLQYWIKSGIDDGWVSPGSCGANPGVVWAARSGRWTLRVRLIVTTINGWQWKCGAGKMKVITSHYTHTRMLALCPFIIAVSFSENDPGAPGPSPATRFLTAIVPDEVAVSVSLVTLRVLKSMKSEFRESFYRVLSPVSAL